jgi:hypothetical protein
VGDSLQNSINNMGVNDTLKVSGGIFVGDIRIAESNGTKFPGRVVAEKNNTIIDGKLIVADGDLFSLPNIIITGDTNFNDTIYPINQSFTDCEFNIIEIRGGPITLTFTDCIINNVFRSLAVNITGTINFVRCDFTGCSFNLLHPNKASIIMTDCIGLPDDVGLDTQNYIVKGTTGYTTKLGAF